MALANKIQRPDRSTENRNTQWVGKKHSRMFWEHVVRSAWMSQVASLSARWANSMMMGTKSRPQPGIMDSRETVPNAGSLTGEHREEVETE